MQTRLALSLIALVLALGFSPSAFAIDIFFNGVKVTGLRTQLFKNCQVRFDKKGNVHITAKGYSVRKVTDEAPATPGATALKQRYFLVSTGRQPRDAQYDIDVFINGKWVVKVRAQGDPVVKEVTEHLKPGKNLVNFTATKNLGGKQRVSASSMVYARIVLGEGVRGGGTVNISRTLADFRASADRTQNFGQAVHVTAR